MRRGTNVGIAGLAVVLADRATREPAVLCRGVTDSSGEFQLSLNRDDASTLMGPGQGSLWDARATVHLAAYKGDVEVFRGSQKITMGTFARGQLPEPLEVDLGAGDVVRFTVYGRVVRGDGTPVESTPVVVERLERGVRTVVADGPTNASGEFNIDYPGAAGSTATHTNLALTLTVNDQAGNVLARTPLVFDPKPRHHLDILVDDGKAPRGLPEFNVVAVAIAANADGTSPAADEVALVAKRSGIDPRLVAMFVQAERLTARGVPPEASYALLRAGHPAAFSAQLALSTSTLRAAFEDALAHNLVGPTLLDGDHFDTGAMLSLYRRLKVEAVTRGDRGNTGALVDASGLSREVTDAFLTRWVAHEDTAEAFWSGLREGEDFDTPTIDTLRFTVDAATLVHGHAPVVAALHDARARGEVSTAADLAAMGRAQWSALVADHGAPPSLGGVDTAAREALYATTIRRVVEATYPTETLGRRFAAAPLEAVEGVSTFLDANPGFEVDRTIVATYLAEHPNAIPRGVDPEQLTANLQRVQRVHALTPPHERYDVTRVLLERGVDSAAAIVHQGRSAFVRAHEAALEDAHVDLSGRAVAEHVYAAAAHRHAFSLALLTRYAASMNTVSIGAIPAYSLNGEEGSAAAELAQIFGSLDYCACEHCRSMFGPAAYLVDLLSSVEVADAQGPLAARRADILSLELSCHNTETALPYIDLVNEVLERASLWPRGIPQSRNTTWTADELRLNPEPTGIERLVGGEVVGPYDGPAEAAFPWTLPIDVHGEAMRAFCEGLGFSRAAAMTLFGQAAGAPVIEPSQLAAERLGMAPHAFALAAATSGTTASSAWGFAFDPENWASQLATDVRRVLDTTGLTHGELVEVFAMRFVRNRPGATVSLAVGYVDDEPSCDVDELELQGFDSFAASSLHRFLRAARGLNLDVHELDIAITAFGGDLDTDTLVALVDALRVRDQLGIPLDEACILWADVDTHVYDGTDSVYARLFANKTVLANVEGTLELDVPLNPAVHFSPLRSALGVHDGDLRLLLDIVGDDAQPDVTLTLVSRLYAHAQLSRALRLSVPDLLGLLRLASIDPFASPAQTIAFLELLGEVRRSGVPFHALDYLCRDAYEPQRGLHLSEQTLADRVEQIANLKADVDTQLVVDGAVHEVLRAHAEAVLATPEDAQELVRILSLETIPSADESDGAWLRGQLSMLVDDPEAYLDEVGPPDEDGSLDTRLREVAQALEETRRELGYELQIVGALASWTTLDAHAVDALAIDLVHVAGMSVRTALVGPLSDAHVAALDKFHRAAMVIEGLGVQTRDLVWIFSHDGGFAEAMNLDDLPQGPVDDETAQATFAQWRDSRLWVELLGDFTTAASESLSVIAEDFAAPGGAGDAAVMALADITGWHVLDIQWASSEAWLGFGPEGIRDPHVMAQLRDMGLAVRRTGVRAEQLATWARTAPDATAADDAKQALRARATASTWPDVIRPISDRLRERRRDALLDFILGRGDFDSADDVYAHYLLDPQMSACTLTSRLKLATSSVQLFVQRALMGLEPDVSFDAAFARDWTWRKNYRVWEAARKVFFYPENWISPELRADKTPFFSQFEAHLRGGDLRPHEIRQGLSNYLHSVREVSKLVVLDVHEDAGDVHVVGRSRNMPYRYFYMRRVQGTYWTPWEPIEVGVSGEHLLLHVMDGRLFLFWLEFIEEVEQKDSGTEDENGDPVINEWEIYRVSLSWTQWRAGTWSEARKSAISRDRFLQRPVDRFLLWGERWGESSLIHVISRGGHAQSAGHRILFRYDLASDEFAEVVDALVAPILPSVFSFNNRVVRGTWEFGTRDTHVQLQGVQGNPPITAIVWPQSDYRLTRTHQDRIPTRPDDHPRADLRPCILDLGGRASLIELEVSVVVWDTSIPTSFEVEYEPIADAGTQPVYPMPSNALRLAAVEDAPILGVATATAAADTALALPNASYAPPASSGLRWSMSTFFHPFAQPMLEALHRDGPDGLYRADGGVLDRQSGKVERFVSIADAEDGDRNRVGPQVLAPYPVDDFDFSHDGAYSTYNWEIFFHIPLFVAHRLRAEGRYARADQWYRYIFDPLGGTDEEGAGRFWNVKPLHDEAAADTPDLVQALFSNDAPNRSDPALRDFHRSLRRWQADPFNPHAIAATRPGTYRWVAVRGYLDNLIDWGDALFRRDSIESINEATQLYVLAANLLGARPKRLEELDVDTETYSTIDFPGLFGGLTQIEGFVPSSPGPSVGGTWGTVGVATTLPPSPAAPSLPAMAPASALGDFRDHPEPTEPPSPLWWTFCLPPNPQLLAYWDRVADRLFKIRNCMNIDGVTRTLPLFEPPIDPALLVRARAAGVDLADAMDGLGAPLPKHRYRVLVARALDLTADVRALGAALLSALEKRDAEALSQLRATHETATLERMRAVREKQVDEARAQVESLEASRALAEQRVRTFTARLSEGMLHPEREQLAHILSAQGARNNRRALELMSMAVAMLPDVSIGTAGFNASFGSAQLSAYYTFLANATSGDASEYDAKAQTASINASHARRVQDWEQQLELAELERAQIDEQLVAAQIRVAIAQREKINHDRQVEQAVEVQRFFEGKYTGQDLYDWMIGEISNLYFQAYKLAFDMAKKAERTMQFELQTDDRFLQFAYWDGLRKGLLSGERLQLDIKRMDAAYLERDARELELTKRISLRLVAPGAVLDLRELGWCEFELPEVLFDLDHPGHYLRRIRAVRVTIPAVTGPHTSVGATLTLLRDDVRVRPDLGHDSVRVTYGGTSQIATSHAQDDGGVFELNFRDDRYLPFEGAGATSRWRLRLPELLRQFDYETIADVEIRIDYTARNGGDDFRSTVQNRLRDDLADALATTSDPGIALVLRATKDFAPDWERFLRPVDEQGTTALELPITRDRLPYVLRGMDVAVTGVDLIVAGEGVGGVTTDVATLNPPEPALATTLAASMGLPVRLGTDLSDAPVAVGQTPWTVDLDGALEVEDPERVEDLWVVVRLVLQG